MIIWNKEDYDKVVNDINNGIIYEEIEVHWKDIIDVSMFKDCNYLDIVSCPKVTDISMLDDVRIKRIYASKEVRDKLLAWHNESHINSNETEKDMYK